MPDVSPLVRLDAVSRRFVTGGGLFSKARESRAVDQVSLDIPEGRVTGIVGESGCGKSTLARLILRLLEPSEGRVSFSGQDLASLSPAALRRLRRDMQMVFQDPYSSIDPRYTIRDAVIEPFVVQGEKLSQAEGDRRAAELLDKVGLNAALLPRRPQELSGGQKQRVGIARALALEPRLVVLDEPTASLDVSVQAQIVALLLDLRARLGLTYVFISHDIGLVRYFCDRIVVMYLGRVVEILPDTRTPPRHLYTRALMDSTFVADPMRRRTIERMSGEAPSPFDLPPGCAFANRCPRASSLCRTQRPDLSGGDHPVACLHPLD